MYAYTLQFHLISSTNINNIYLLLAYLMTLPIAHYIFTNYKIINEFELEYTWKQMSVSYFEVLYWYVPAVRMKMWCFTEMLAWYTLQSWWSEPHIPPEQDCIALHPGETVLVSGYLLAKVSLDLLLLYMKRGPSVHSAFLSSGIRGSLHWRQSSCSIGPSLHITYLPLLHSTEAKGQYYVQEVFNCISKRVSRYKILTYSH
jgi:hypothetical protein